MNQSGFTLLELLVSMAIVSILTAIAVPQYQQYRRTSFDMRAQADLRNVAIAEEAYFLESESYLSCRNEECDALPGIATLSEGTLLEIAAEDGSFTGSANHPKGTGKAYSWDTNKGGMIRQ